MKYIKLEDIENIFKHIGRENSYYRQIKRLKTVDIPEFRKDNAKLQEIKLQEVAKFLREKIKELDDLLNK